LVDPCHPRLDVIGVVVFNEVIECQLLQFFERRRFNDHQLGTRILACNIFACVSGFLTGETLKQTTCDFDFPELASASISLLKNSTIAWAGGHFRPRPTLTFIMQELQEPIRLLINDMSFSGTGVTHVAQTQTGRIWRLALLCIVRNKDLHGGKRLSL